MVNRNSKLQYDHLRRLARLVTLGTLCVACGTNPFVNGIDDKSLSTTETLRVTPGGELVADGVSEIPITVTYHSAVSPTRVVQLSASAGVFVSTGKGTLSLALGDKEEVSVRFRSPRIGETVHISSAAGSVNRSDTIVVRPALPDVLLLQPRDSFVITGAPAGQLTIIATLRRTIGFVSPGAIVTFSDSDSLPIGRRGVFSTPTLSDSLGRVEVRYTPGVVDTTALGPRTLYACTAATAGPVCGSTTIFLTR